MYYCSIVNSLHKKGIDTTTICDNCGRNILLLDEIPSTLEYSVFIPAVNRIDNIVQVVSCGGFKSKNNQGEDNEHCEHNQEN